jgi:hypothetical protein
MRSKIKEFIGDGGRDAEASGGVFSVDYDQIYLALFNDVAQVFAHDAASCAPENVSYKKNAQKSSKRQDKKF